MNQENQKYMKYVELNNNGITDVVIELYKPKMFPYIIDTASQKRHILDDPSREPTEKITTIYPTVFTNKPSIIPITQNKFSVYIYLSLLIFIILVLLLCYKYTSVKFGTYYKQLYIHKIYKKFDYLQERDEKVEFQNIYPSIDNSITIYEQV
jgi:hypothetical protein